ncbi:MAG: ECF-type sigma factor [Bryobacter sp.]|jgi:RNA polymerase sigma factor (TIGR02999 family)|nr:ECF-type sigma factor [Bryobacter sp.]
MPARGEVTEMLLSLQAGDRSVVDRLAPLLYDELRQIAGAIFRQERAQHTMQPTAVVHEAYLRLVEQEAVSFTTRSHFLAIAARVMRQVLVDASRARLAEKRGGGAVKVELNEELHGGIARADHDVMALHRALDDLAALDSRKAKIIEMRYFGGLTGEEIAGVLEIGTATVTRDLRMAEAWLARALGAA